MGQGSGIAAPIVQLGVRVAP